MQFTVQIPDEVAQRLSVHGGDLPRRALEALAAQEYRLGHLHKPDLRSLFGFETSDQIDSFLKHHGVYEEYTMEELEQELAGLKRLGL